MVTVMVTSHKVTEKNVICEYIDDVKKLQKTTECCGRAREFIEKSLMIYLYNWKYWYIAQKGLKYRKWMSR